MSAQFASARRQQTPSTAAMLAALTAALLTIAFYLLSPARALATVIVTPPPHDRPERDRVRPWPPQPAPVAPAPAPIQIESVDLDVDIHDAVATTELRQKIRNPHAWSVEAQFVLPIPRGAAVHDAALRVDGQLVEAELLEAGRARAAYEDIVRRNVDPALVEYLEDGLLRTRVFPVPAHGTREIQLTLTIALAEDFGVWQYRFPLRALCGAQAAPRELSVRGQIRAAVALGEPYSPTHALDVDLERGSRRARFELRATGGPVAATDLQLFVPTRTRDLTFTVASTRPAGEDGFVLLRVTPGELLERREPTPRRVVFVLDTSGSMDGEKLEQAKAALRAGLQTLDRQDEFAVVTYGSSVIPWSEAMQPASAARVRDALGQVTDMRARGGTNIGAALQTAFALLGRRDARPAYILFMTDGLPTVGTTSVDELLERARRDNRSGAHLFVFGVGHDVNTRLLDNLAQDSGAPARYVQPGEDLEVAVSNLAAQISDPLWTDVEMELAGAGLYDMIPERLPDLFRGQSLTVLARYRRPGQTKLIFSGEQGGSRERSTEQIVLARHATAHAYLPQLWAGRRIAVLQAALQNGGDRRELVQEIVELATRYGIVTEYTSLLMREPDMQVARAVRQRAAVPHALMQSAGNLAAEESGQGAVKRSAQSSRMFEAQSLAQQHDAAATSPSPAMAGQRNSAAAGPAMPGKDERTGTQGATRVVNGRTFDVDSQQRWVDRLAVGATPRLQVKAFSEAYFEVLSLRPELGALLSVGPHVLVAVDRDVLEIGPAGIEQLDDAARAWLRVSTVQ